jgi:ABC-2 type transport system ATP-binding protein
VQAADAPPGVHDVSVDGGRFRCQVDQAAMAEFTRWLAGYGVRSLVSQPPTLEELFLRHYKTPAATGHPAGAPR